MQEFCAATKEYCPPGKAGMPGTPGTHGIMGLKGKRGSRGRPGSKVKSSSYSYTDLKTNHEYHCTVFRKAYILSGSGFLEFLYSIIESFKKPVKLLSLFLISCVFTKKKTLANFRDMEISLVVLPCHFIG